MILVRFRDFFTQGIFSLGKISLCFLRIRMVSLDKFLWTDLITFFRLQTTGRDFSLFLPTHDHYRYCDCLNKRRDWSMEIFVCWHKQVANSRNWTESHLLVHNCYVVVGKLTNTRWYCLGSWWWVREWRAGDCTKLSKLSVNKYHMGTNDGNHNSFLSRRNWPSNLTEFYTFMLHRVKALGGGWAQDNGN